MVKRLLSIAAVIALFSAVALAQEGPAEGPPEGPDTVAVQAGPADGPMEGLSVMTLRGDPEVGHMEGPGPRVFQMRVRGPMGPGPRMWFHGRGIGQWWRDPGIAEKIGLSDQQKQQLEKISQDSRLKAIDLRADLEKQQVILGPMLQAYHPDEAQALAQVEKVSQARAALEKQRIQTMLAARSVLTEDQWNKLKETRMDFHHRAGRRGSPRHMGRGSPATPSGK